MAHSIVYTPELHPEYGHISALKTRPFYHGLPAPLDVIIPKRAELNDLMLAHDADYVNRLFNGAQDNGFGNRDDRVVEHCQWTVGAMVTAAERAMRQKTPVCAPVAGFHHAGWEHAAGFCTFNGLMVAAVKVIMKGVRNVVIVDLDTHYGDGTDDIASHIYLKHGIDGITNLTHFQFHNHGAGAWSRDWGKLQRQLKGILPAYLNDAGLVLYQAGMDAHVDDEIGPGYLSADQLAERDRMVFQACKDANVPVAWCLAGGYQSMAKIVALHWQTWHAMTRVYG